MNADVALTLGYADNWLVASLLMKVFFVNDFE